MKAQVAIKGLADSTLMEIGMAIVTETYGHGQARMLTHIRGDGIKQPGHPLGLFPMNFPPFPSLFPEDAAPLASYLSVLGTAFPTGHNTQAKTRPYRKTGVPGLVGLPVVASEAQPMVVVESRPSVKRLKLEPRNTAMKDVAIGWTGDRPYMKGKSVTKTCSLHMFDVGPDFTSEFRTPEMSFLLWYCPTGDLSSDRYACVPRCTHNTL
ncbi:hypothetical protein H4582DRAFT_2051244 [Lactarius indigo]|nr:hypothetical protein H4582DRAFT_2051244 [Lactarius indigo]